MIEATVKIVLLLNIFICLIQAALVRNQMSEQLNNNNYQQNSLDEPRFPSRTKSALKEEKSFDYNKANRLDNRVLDNFDHRYPDGSYEFRYELADGQTRYERGYFVNVNKQKSLVVVGYYSYRMPNDNYVTVFYNADQYGYRQNQAITRDTLPNLPRTIEVPESREEQSDDIDVTTIKHFGTNQVTSTTKRNRI